MLLLLLLIHFSHVWLFATPWIAAYQASPSMGFSRQEYWSRVPLPSPTFRIHHAKCWAGWSTSWNQDCQEKYNNLKYANDTTLMAEWRGTEKPLDESERGEWKSWLKTQHSENKNHTSGPITLWQIDVETMETVTDFVFLGSKITADGDCSHEIKRSLLLGRKAMTNLDSILKCRDITLLTKVRLVKAMVFPVVMYGCESRTIKKAECRRFDAFELWCWRRLLRVP